MNQKQKDLLAKLGLAAGADDSATAAFIDALSAENKAELTALGEDATAPKADSGAQASASAAAIERAALASYQARTQEIEDLAVLSNKPATWIKEQRASKTPVSEIRAALAKERAAANAPVQTRVEVGSNLQLVALREGIRDGIALRGSAKIDKPHELASKFRQMSITQLGAAYLRGLGVQGVDFMAEAQVATLCLNQAKLRAALGAGDYSGQIGTFTGILTDAANRTLTSEWDGWQPKWKIFAEHVSLKDLRPTNRGNIGFVPMAAVAQGDDVVFSTLASKNEVLTAAKYRGGTVWSLEQWINDDVGAFTRFPSNCVFICGQLEDSLALGVLINNNLLSDGNALFLAAGARNNLVTPGTAITVDNWGGMRAKIKAQKEAGGNKPLNLEPNVCICPAGKAAAARRELQSTTDPSTNGAADNPWKRDNIIVVDSPELDASSATRWYAAVGAGRPGCSIEVGHVAGLEKPVIEYANDFDSDVMRIACRHFVAAGAIDFRGLARNDGA